MIPSPNSDMNIAMRSAARVMVVCLSRVKSVAREARSHRCGNGAVVRTYIENTLTASKGGISATTSSSTLRLSAVRACRLVLQLGEELSQDLIRERVVDEPDVGAANLEVQMRIGLLGGVPVDDSVRSRVDCRVANFRVENLTNVVDEPTRATVCEAITVLCVDQR